MKSTRARITVPISTASNRDGSPRWTLKSNVPGYRKQAYGRLPVSEKTGTFDVATLQVIRPLSAIVYLGPRASASSQTSYDWSRPYRIVDRNPAVTETPCFAVPQSVAANLDAVRTLATASEITVDYEYRSVQESDASCSAVIAAANGASFANALSGTGAGVGLDQEVYVSRHQIANAVLKARLSIALSCRSAKGEEQLRDLVGKRLESLLPVIMNNLQFQSKSWDDVQSKLVTFSFDGQDARTKITDYVNKFHDVLKTTREQNTNVKTEGEYLQLAKGKLDVDTKGRDERDETRDVDFQRKGEKVIAPTLDVLVLRSGGQTLNTAVSVREVSIAQKGKGSRRIKAPVSAKGNCAPCQEFHFKANTPYRYNRSEVSCGRIVFDAGARVDLAPAGTLRLEAEQIRVLGPASIWGEGTKGKNATPGSDRGEWPAPPEQYESVKQACCINKQCNANDIGGDAEPRKAEQGPAGADIFFSVTPEGLQDLQIHNSGGAGGDGAQGGRGKVFKNTAGFTIPGNTCEAPRGKPAEQGDNGRSGKVCYEDVKSADCQ